MNRSRRQFLAAAAAGLGVGVLRPRRLAGARRAEFTPLRRNVGIFTERGGTMGWLVNGDGVLVVDSQFADTAPIFLEGLRERTPRTIDVLVNSHHHGDHTGGNGALRPAVRQIVAHARAVENQRRFANANAPAPTVADVTLTDTWSVRIGDETVSARHYGPAHTGGDIAIHFEEADIVHLGDLLNNRGYANVDGPSGASVMGWVSTLESIVSAHTASTLYIFGHAGEGHPLTGTSADLGYQRDYFLAVLDAAREARREGKSKEELVAMESLRGFEEMGGTQSRLGLALGIAYDEVGGG